MGFGLVLVIWSYVYFSVHERANLKMKKEMLELVYCFVIDKLKDTKLMTFSCGISVLGSDIYLHKLFK